MKKVIKFFAWFIPVIVAIIALFPQLIEYSKKKELSYNQIESSELKGPINSAVKFVINEKQYTELHVSFLEFENTGDIPITKDEFEKPITICLSERYSIYNPLSLLFYTIVDRTPQELEVKLINNDTNLTNSIIIEPLLLNPRDKFTVQFVTNQKPSSINVTARISGIKTLNQTQPKKVGVTFIQIINSYFFILLLIFTFFLLLKNTLSLYPVYCVIESITTNIGYISICLFLLFTNFNDNFSTYLHWSVYLFFYIFLVSRPYPCLVSHD
jgi:hypothetical protein